MPTPQASAARSERLLRRLLIGVVVVVALGWWSDYAGRQRVVDYQRTGCERGKDDRAANAEAFRAQSTYLDLVLEARSVQQDVKDAAAVNQRVQDAAATSLESRTGDRLDCRDAYPSAPLVALP